MSNRHYTLNLDAQKDIRSNAKLLSASTARFGGDWHSVPHAHNYAELFYTVGGRGQFRINDRLYPVKVNQLVIVNPHVLHTEVSYESTPLEYIVLGIEGLELAVQEEETAPFCILDCQRSDDILSCMRSILREVESQQPGYERICQAYMEILVLRLARQTAVCTPAPQVAAAASRQCAAVRRYIDMHFKEPLNLDQLAGEAFVNKYYLAHAFKREYGISPINYMLSRRIAESKYLLSETDMPLSQISQALGFSSPSYFSQAFRRSEGLSPTEYRQQLRQKLQQSTPKPAAGAASHSLDLRHNISI